MSYWDSSALVKLYARETDSGRFEQLAFLSRTYLATSRLALYEIQTTLRRKQAEGTLSRESVDRLLLDLATDVAAGALNIIEFSDLADENYASLVASCFQRSPPIYLRTLDGIHLASALARGELDFVAADIRLRQAAAALGLRVLP